MQEGIILDASDVKKIIAEHFGVDESAVIKSQYSYTVAGVKAKQEEEDDIS